MVTVPRFQAQKTYHNRSNLFYSDASPSPAQIVHLRSPLFRGHPRCVRGPQPGRERGGRGHGHAADCGFHIQRFVLRL